MGSLSLGQRRSFDGHLCTIRHVGTVQGTTGDWLGVEWDDATRGKHSGEHKGIRYFSCKWNRLVEIIPLTLIPRQKQPTYSGVFRSPLQAIRPTPEPSRSPAGEVCI